MKKILILANVSTSLYNFRFELVRELIQQGFQVYFTVIEPKEDEKVKLLVEAGAVHFQTPFERRGTNPIKDLQLVSQYHKIIKDVDPDIVLTYTVKPNIYGTFVASRFHKPVIMNITGIGSGLATRNRYRNMVQLMYKLACQRAFCVFFQNRANLDFFLKNRLVDDHKVRLIPGSGVNIDKFVPIGKSSKDNMVKFLFVGRIMKEKGVDEYLAAAEAITEEFPNAEFQLLGSFEEEEYRDVLFSIKNNRIKYLGISSDVRNEIKEVDCIVNPSYHEGMSNVLLEGAAMGKPLIASDIPGCKEIIEDGHNGFLFKAQSTRDLIDKLVQFMKLDRNARAVMGVYSRKKVETEFDRNIVIRQYLEVINDILKSKVI